MKGKVVAKDGTNTINVTEVETYHGSASGNTYWHVAISGNNSLGRTHLFKKDNWDFIEDEPTTLERVQAYKQGTVFKFTGSYYQYVKISDTQVAWVNTKGGQSGITIIDIEFSGGEKWSPKLEVIE